MTTNKLALGIVLGGSLTSIMTLAIVLALFSLDSVNSTFTSESAIETDSNSQTIATDRTAFYGLDLGSEDISFEYPLGWHITGLRDYEALNGTLPSLKLALDPEPQVLTSPWGGPLTRQIEFSSLIGDEAMMAEYEDLPAYMSYKKDEIMINGKTAERLVVTTDMNHPEFEAYGIPYMERLWIKGDQRTFVAYHYYTEASEANEPAWELFKSTLSIK